MERCRLTGRLRRRFPPFARLCFTPRAGVEHRLPLRFGFSTFDGGLSRGEIDEAMVLLDQLLTLAKKA